MRSILARRVFSSSTKSKWKKSKKSSSSSSQRITIYASEVAALIGENPYRSMSQALPDLMLRSFRSGTEIGDKIRGMDIKTEEERFVESSKRTGSEDVIEKIMSNISKDTDTSNLSEIKREIEEKMDDVISKQPSQERKQEASSLKAKIQSKVQRAYGTIQEDSALGMLEKTNLIEKASDTVEKSIERLGETASLKRADTDALKSEVKQALVQKLNDVKIEEAGDIEKKFTDEKWHQVSEEAVENMIRGSKVLSEETKKEFMKSKLPKLRHKLAHSVKEAAVSGNNTKWYYRKLGNTSRSNMLYGVGGRIDGFSNGNLVEVKNRVKRIPDMLPGYDMIQIQTYLHILKLPQCIVVQRLKNQKDISTRLEVNAWTNSEWNSRVLSRLQIFSDFVDEITNMTPEDSEIDIVTRIELLQSLSHKGEKSEGIIRRVFINFFEKRMNEMIMHQSRDDGHNHGGGIVLG